VNRLPKALARLADLRWLYVLAALPTMTDLIETGALPGSPRAWVTEIVVGLVIAALVGRVRKDHAALLALAGSDPLTGLQNRRAFDHAVEEECARARRTRQPLSLVCIDLDNFKQINDRGGHAAGDEVLLQLAAAIRGAVRSQVDGGFRVGGDEFALLLPGSSAHLAELVVARILQSCQQSDPVWVEGILGISWGVVEYQPPEAAVDFIRRADAAMYQNKRPGKIADLHSSSQSVIGESK
jgi:diguanylate cyclase (GGDEF)-like protein